MPIWDKALLSHDIEAFIEHLQRLEAQGCRWLVVPLTADESSGSLKCSKCNNDTNVAARVIVKCCGSAGHDQAASLGWLSLE
jgi:hypothetical protein